MNEESYVEKYAAAGIEVRQLAFEPIRHHTVTWDRDQWSVQAGGRPNGFSGLRTAEDLQETARRHRASIGSASALRSADEANRLADLYTQAAEDRKEVIL